MDLTQVGKWAGSHMDTPSSCSHWRQAQTFQLTRIWREPPSFFYCHPLTRIIFEISLMFPLVSILLLFHKLKCQLGYGGKCLRVPLATFRSINLMHTMSLIILRRTKFCLNSSIHFSVPCNSQIICCAICATNLLTFAWKWSGWNWLCPGGGWGWNLFGHRQGRWVIEVDINPIRGSLLELKIDVYTL